MMDAKVARWELRPGERECASAMKRRGRTRWMGRTREGDEGPLGS
jgi:hypothetical protein